MLPALWIVLAGCSSQRLELVSVSPHSGWADGCSPVRLSGHAFDADTLGATIGQLPLVSPTSPDPEAAPLDVGFVVDGLTPAHPPGVVDVVLQQSGASSRLVDGFRYLECPGPRLDAAAPARVPGDGVVRLTGCGLDPAVVFARVESGGNVELLPLKPRCGTGGADVAVAGLAPGAWVMSLVDTTGEVLWPAPCDTADTGDVCEFAFELEVVAP